MAQLQSPQKSNQVPKEIDKKNLSTPKVDTIFSKLFVKYLGFFFLANNVKAT